MSGEGESQPELRIDFVQRVRDAKGVERLYFRKAGCARRPLASPWGSDALRQEVQAILDKLAAKPKPRAGDIKAATDAYRKSADFKALDETTQAEYKRWLKEFDEDNGDVLLSDITPAYLLDLRDAWAVRGHRAANVAMQVLKNTLKRPMITGEVTPGIFDPIEKVARPRDLPEPHPVWLEGEIKAVFDAAPEGLRRAIALGRYAGMRRGDAIRVTETARRNGRLAWVSSKRRVEVDIKEDPRLAEILAATPRRAVTIAYDVDGAPFKDGRVFNKALEALIAGVAKKGECRPGLTMHGLRHTFGVALALGKATDAEIMAAMGHSTTAAAVKYRRQADRIRLSNSAMDKVIPLAPPAEKKGDDAAENGGV